MGLGDWILATSQVRSLNQIHGKPVLVVNRLNKPQWSEIFENNPRILRAPDEDPNSFITLLNASGNRPYIANKGYQKWTWRRWDISPGELWFTEEERAFACAAGVADKVVIEPHTKVPNSNKAWAFSRWQQVVDSGVAQFVQLGGPKTLRLQRVDFIQTESFRQAAALLQQSRGVVTTEGALHHAAAALGVPAVVLWSEYIAPEFTGYASQTNIRHAGKVCGSRLPCYGCKVAMAAISVEEVVQAIKERMR